MNDALTNPFCQAPLNIDRNKIGLSGSMQPKWRFLAPSKKEKTHFEKTQQNVLFFLTLHTKHIDPAVYGKADHSII